MMNISYLTDVIVRFILRDLTILSAPVGPILFLLRLERIEYGHSFICKPKTISTYFTEVIVLVNEIA